MGDAAPDGQPSKTSQGAWMEIIHRAEAEGVPRHGVVYQQKFVSIYVPRTGYLKGKKQNCVKRPSKARQRPQAGRQRIVQQGWVKVASEPNNSLPRRTMPASKQRHGPSKIGRPALFHATRSHGSDSSTENSLIPMHVTSIGLTCTFAKGLRNGKEGW